MTFHNEQNLTARLQVTEANRTHLFEQMQFFSSERQENLTIMQKVASKNETEKIILRRVINLGMSILMVY